MVVSQVVEGCVAGVDEDGSGGQVDVRVELSAAKAKCSPLVGWNVDMQPAVRKEPSLGTSKVMLKRVGVLGSAPKDTSARSLEPTRSAPPIEKGGDHSGNDLGSDEAAKSLHVGLEPVSKHTLVGGEIEQVEPANKSLPDEVAWVRGLVGKRQPVTSLLEVLSDQGVHVCNGMARLSDEV